MPLPNPRKGEKKTDFISRCISKAVKDGMPQDQAIAACHDIWRKPKQKMDLKFNYSVPITQKGLIDDDFIIQGTAINAITTSSNFKFLEEELKPAAKTLTGVPLLKNHDNEVESIMGKVLKGRFDNESKSIQFKAKVINPTMQQLITDDILDSVSVGVDVANMEEDGDILIPRGLKFRELSLVAVGADKDAKFDVALKLAYDTKLHSQSKPEGEVKMGKDEIKEKDEEITKLKEEVKSLKKTVEQKAEEKTKAANEVKAKEEADAKEAEEVKTKEEEEAKAKEESDAKAKEEEKKKADDEAEAKKKAEEEAAAEGDEGDEEEAENTEQKGSYTVEQGNGAIKGGSSTLVRG